MTKVFSRGIGRRWALGEELLGEALPGENGDGGGASRCSRWKRNEGGRKGLGCVQGGRGSVYACVVSSRRGRSEDWREEALERRGGDEISSSERVVHAREARRRLRRLGERRLGGSRARGEISKPELNSAHMSVDRCSEVGQGSSAISSKNVNCAQKFVNTKLVEEI